MKYYPDRVSQYLEDAWKFDFKLLSKYFFDKKNTKMLVKIFDERGKLPYRLRESSQFLIMLLETDPEKALGFIQQNHFYSDAYTEESVRKLYDSKVKRIDENGIEKEVSIISLLEQIPYGLRESSQILTMLLETNLEKSLKFIQQDQFKVEVYESDQFKRCLLDCDEEIFYSILKTKYLISVSPKYFGLYGEGLEELIDELKNISGMARTPSLEFIKKMLYLQVALEYEEARKNTSKRYLQGNVGEEVKDTLMLNGNIDVGIENQLTSYLMGVTSGETVKGLIREKTLSKEDKIARILKKSGITKVKRLAVWEGERDSIIYEEISERLSELRLDDESESKEILTTITKTLVEMKKKAFEAYKKDPQDKEAGQIIDEICDIALNAQQNSEVGNIYIRLLKGVKRDFLELTPKGKEKIQSRKKIEVFNATIEKRREKVIEAIMGEFDMDRTEAEKICQLYTECKEPKDFERYEERKGNPKKKKIISFKAVLASRLVTDSEIGEISQKDILKLDLTSDNFQVPMRRQIHRFILSILSNTVFGEKSDVIDITRNNLGEITDSRINSRMRKLLENVKKSMTIEDKVNSESLIGIESLIGLTESSIFDSKSIGLISVLYLPINEKLKRLNKNEEVSYTINNYLEYARIGLRMTTPDMSNSILGSYNCEILSKKSNVQENLTHYIKNMANRSYRNIPTVKGECEGIYYEAYSVDDPEQLIAGARISGSCFRIGNAQSNTINLELPKSFIIFSSKGFKVGCLF